jgi:hypothetical protein
LELYAALSSSSGGTNGGRSTRAENQENQLLAAWNSTRHCRPLLGAPLAAGQLVLEKLKKSAVSSINCGTLRGIVVLFWGHHWRQVNSYWKTRKSAVSCVDFITLRGIVVHFWGHHWRQVKSCGKSRKPVVSCLKFGTLRVIVVPSWGHHWRKSAHFKKAPFI